MNKYYRILVFSLITMCTASIFCISSASGEKTVLLFRTQPSNLGIQKSSQFPTNSDLEITLPGRLYNPPIELTEINKKDINRNTPEMAEVSFYSANRKGDTTWILDCWAREDRSEIQQLLEEHLAYNTELFQQIHKSYITGKAEYNDYTILFITNRYKDKRESKLAHTYTNTPQGWKITNALSNDKTYDIIFSSLRSGSVMTTKQ